MHLAYRIQVPLLTIVFVLLLVGPAVIGVVLAGNGFSAGDPATGLVTSPIVVTELDAPVSEQ